MINFKLDFKTFKPKWEEIYRPKIYLLVSFILVFVFGFGVGNIKKDKEIINNRRSATQTQNQNKIEKTTATAAAQTKPEQATTSLENSNCVVKGNINSSGKRIYHVASGAFYKTVKPEQCFESEEAAQKAGFVKSSR